MYHLMNNLPVFGTLGMVALLAGPLARLPIDLGAWLLEMLVRWMCDTGPRIDTDGAVPAGAGRRMASASSRCRHVARSWPGCHDHGGHVCGILDLLIGHPAIGTIDLFLAAGAAQEFAEAAASRRGAEAHVHGLEACDGLGEPRDGPRRIAAEGGQAPRMSRA